VTKKPADPPNPEDTGRKQGGRFRPGRSGNPEGRPRGSRNAATVLAEELLAEDIKAIVEKVKDEAKAGNMVAARLVLERIAPVRRGRAIAIDLPRIDTPADLAVAHSAVIAAVAAGDLTPEEGQSMSDILEGKRRAIEITELEARIAALEKGIAK